MIAWEVYKPWGGMVGGRMYYVDTVFFTDDCDAGHVRKCLIEHDGFPPTIKVFQRK